MKWARRIRSVGRATSAIWHLHRLRLSSEAGSILRGKPAAPPVFDSRIVLRPRAQHDWAIWAPKNRYPCPEVPRAPPAPGRWDRLPLKARRAVTASIARGGGRQARAADGAQGAAGPPS